MDRDFVPVSSPVERSAPIRLVLDTNIMVSALISKKGPPGFLLAAAKGEGCTLITSRFQIDELQRVLAREQLRVNIRRRNPTISSPLLMRLPKWSTSCRK